VWINCIYRGQALWLALFQKDEQGVMMGSSGGGESKNGVQGTEKFVSFLQATTTAWRKYVCNEA